MSKVIYGNLKNNLKMISTCTIFSIHSKLKPCVCVCICILIGAYRPHPSPSEPIVDWRTTDNGRLCRTRLPLIKNLRPQPVLYYKPSEILVNPYGAVMVRLDEESNSLRLGSSQLEIFVNMHVTKSTCVFSLFICDGNTPCALTWHLPRYIANDFLKF